MFSLHILVHYFLLYIEIYIHKYPLFVVFLNICSWNNNNKKIINISQYTSILKFINSEQRIRKVFLNKICIKQ